MVLFSLHYHDVNSVLCRGRQTESNSTHTRLRNVWNLPFSLVDLGLALRCISSCYRSLDLDLPSTKDLAVMFGALSQARVESKISRQIKELLFYVTDHEIVIKKDDRPLSKCFLYTRWCRMID